MPNLRAVTVYLVEFLWLLILVSKRVGRGGNTCDIKKNLPLRVLATICVRSVLTDAVNWTDLFSSWIGTGDWMDLIKVITSLSSVPSG